jgi:hypothetical protein
MALVAEVSRRLTERDRFLIGLLGEHRVFTTAQIHELAFESRRRAELRCAELYRLRVLERFRPFRAVGSAPYHFVLDDLGARVLAVEKGGDGEPSSFRRTATLALERSQRLEHLVGTNGFFTSLVGSARHGSAMALRAWWSEARCARAWGESVRPDGFGIWEEESRRLAFFLEHDNGTETTERLAEKLAGYEDLARRAGEVTAVLFSFASPGREAAARRALAPSLGPGQARTPVATAVRAAGVPPVGPVWLPVASDGPRRRLIALADPSEEHAPQRGAQGTPGGGTAPLEGRASGTPAPAVLPPW